MVKILSYMATHDVLDRGLLTPGICPRMVALRAWWLVPHAFVLFLKWHKIHSPTELLCPNLRASPSLDGTANVRTHACKHKGISDMSLVYTKIIPLFSLTFLNHGK
jgi:hypothetical protein